MSAPTNPVIDSVVDGRYQVEAELARGGMATVYRARDLRLDRPVALKVMRDELARDGSFVRRFVHEARMAARLQHPHIVSVYDQGQDGDVVYLAMELVEGSTLRDVISLRAPVSTRRALALVIPVVEALAAAHALGLVHRDVKPENVLINGHTGAVKVTDFGLARLEGNPNMTTEMLWGTAAYLAPEQVETGAADARTDVYAVALVLFELLTGQKAFPGDDAFRVAYEHVHGSVPRARTVVPSVPEAVEELIMRAGATEPEDRPRHASELLGELGTLEASLTDDELDAVPIRHDETVPVFLDRADGDPTHVVSPGAGQGDLTSPLGSTTRRIPVRSGNPRAVSEDGRYARTTGNQPLGVTRPPERPGRATTAWVMGIMLFLVLLAGGYGLWYFTEGPAVHSSMPVVVGLPEEQAVSALEDQELDPVVSLAHSEDVPSGVVIEAGQEPGTRLRHGTDVALVVSQGPERYAVPQLEGSTLEQAQAVLAENNLKLGEQAPQHHETLAAGQIVSSSPAAGEQVPPGTSVDVVVSQGPAPVEVPDVVGSTQEEASAALTAAGLAVQVAPGRVEHADIPEGSVVSQHPGPSAVERGTTVTIVISKGSDQVTVPRLVGKRFSEVERELGELGLQVKREDLAGGLLGTVVEQSVDPGTEVPKGTEIVVRVV